MKVFVLLSRVPWPLDKGDKLRAYWHLAELAKKHDVFLCCLTDETPSDEAIATLSALVKRMEIFPLTKMGLLSQIAFGALGKKPFQVHYFYRKHIANAIRSILLQWKPDHIYCQLIRTAEYVKHYHDCPKTLDYMDAFSAGIQRRAQRSNLWWRWFWRAESQRLLRYEHLVFEYFEHHTIISDQDRQLIYHPKRQSITVVPNGVDADFFSSAGEEKSIDLLFTGNMSYAPNVRGAERIVNRILPLLPLKTLVQIAGADPTDEVLALRSTNVSVTGRIPDIRVAYATARIFIAPMEMGAGMQNKILEAMAMHMPCIVSPLAAKALYAQGDQALWVADSDADFARMIQQLLDQPATRTELGERARRYVMKHYSWQINTLPLLRLLEQHP